MFVSAIKVKGHTYVCIVESVMKPGSKYSTHKVIQNLGRLDKLIEKHGDPNYLENLKAQYRRQSAEKTEAQAEARQQFSSRLLAIEPSSDDRVNPEIAYGHYALRQLWIEDLGMPRILERLAAKHEAKRSVEEDSTLEPATFDVNAAISYLAYAKVIAPGSILRAYRKREGYLGDPLRDLTLDNLYSALSFLKQNKEPLFREVGKRLDKRFGKERATLVFYDVTNAYFETPLTDEEKKREQMDFPERLRAAAKAARLQGELGDECFNDEGEVLVELLPDAFLDAVANEKIQYLRMRGPSKEHRSDLPIVSIALAVDRKGFPLDVEIFAGNCAEMKSMEEAITSLQAKYDIKDSIVVADRGLNSVYNLKKLKEMGLGFCVAQRVTQFPKDLRDKMLDKSLYTPIYAKDPEKARIQMINDYEKTGADGATIKCKLVLTWDEDRYKRDEAILDAWERLIKRKAKNREKVNPKRSGWTSLAKFEGTQTESTIIGVDERAREKKSQFSGYAGLVFAAPDGMEESLDNVSPLELTAVYRQLTQIEDCFFIMKSFLGLRPMYVYNTDHIRGHVILCVLALILIRLLQERLSEFGEHLSIRDITESLNDACVNVSERGGEFYFQPCCRNVAETLRKGRERMPVEELLALQKKGKIRASHMGAILRACGCGPIPSYGTRRDLARVLRTRFPDPSDAVAELIRAQVISI